jgi:Nucleotidyl transferase AbiEii toxin, Type IV TA system
MSIALLQIGASALGDLTHEVVFTGGATIGLWITDPAAPEPRATEDVDVIVEVTSRSRFADFEQRLRKRGFREDQESGVICRWRHADADLVLDVMPTDASILGFANRWQGAAVPHAIQCELPSGFTIAAVSPPFLIATKLEAFANRGRNDYIASRDFADVVSLLDGRAELIEEIATAPEEVRRYVGSELSRHQEHPHFLDGIYAGLPPDDASQERAAEIVLPRLAVAITLGAVP